MNVNRIALTSAILSLMAASTVLAGTITADLGRKGGIVVLYDANVVETQEGFPQSEMPLTAKRGTVTWQIPYAEIEAVIIKQVTQTTIIADVLRWNGRNVYDARIFDFRMVKGFEAPGEEGSEIRVDVRSAEEIQFSGF